MSDDLVHNNKLYFSTSAVAALIAATIAAIVGMFAQDTEASEKDHAFDLALQEISFELKAATAGREVISTNLVALEQKVDTSIKELVFRREMQNFASELARRNVTLDVPQVEN